MNPSTNGKAPDRPPSASALDGAAPGGRDRLGKFCRGNKLSKGNASNRRMAALRAALFADLDEGKMQALGQRLYERALAGDLEAVKLVLLYACGRPRESPDEDSLDLQQWRLLRQFPTMSQVWFVLDQLGDPALAAELFRDKSAATAAELFQQIRRVTESAPRRFAQAQLDEAAARTGK
jgi:hypothetical protein